jgi:hypothetical protein
MDRIQDVRDMYNKEPGGFTTGDDGPWEGAVEIHLPVILEKIETAVPKVQSALWRAHPFASVKSPSGEMNGQSTREVERFLEWAFRNDIEYFYEVLENFVRNCLLDGTAVMKTIWERRWRRAIEISRLKTYLKEGEIDVFGNPIKEARPKTTREMVLEVVGFGDPENTVMKLDKTGKRTFDLQFTEAGRIYDATAEFQDTDVLNEVELKIARNIIEYDAPKCTNIDLQDIIMPFRSTNIQEAKWVAHRTRYTLEEVRAKRDSGDWEMSEEDFRWMSGQRRENDDKSPIQDQKDKMLGGSVNTGTAATVGKEGEEFDPNSISVFEVYAKDFADGSGQSVNVIHYLPEDLNRIVGTEYQDEVFPHGQRPFAAMRYITVANRFYGTSMGELLYAINFEVDNTISLTHNLMELVSNPFFFYSPFGAASNPDVLKGVKPGEGVPTSDPNSVRFAEFAQQPLALLHGSFNEMLGYADRLTFSPSVGGSTNYRNAPRTARGTLALMGAAEERLSTIVEQMQATSWKDIVSQVTSLYGRYVSVDKWYSVTGESEPRRMNPKQLRGNLQFSFSGSLTSVNRAEQQAKAEKRYMVARQDPLYNSDPRAMQALLRDFLEFTSEGTDSEKLIPALPGEGGYDHAPLEQDIENEAMAQGIRITVLPGDNHQKHIAEIAKFRKSEAFRGLSTIAVSLIAEHNNGHVAAMQQQAAMSQRASSVASGMAPDQQAPAQQGAPQPGVPVEGVPALGGDLSNLEGGQQ